MATEPSKASFSGAEVSRAFVRGKKTREDHKQVSDQLYAMYAEGRDLRGLVAIVGKGALSERDIKVLEFADHFEEKFVRQGRDEDRTFEETLDLGWKLLSALPDSVLTRLDRKTMEKWHPRNRAKSGAPAMAVATA